MSTKKSPKLCGVKAPFGGGCSGAACQLHRGHAGHHAYWIYSWRKQPRGARFFPKPGQVLAKVEHRGTFDVVNTRIVSAIEKRYPRGTVVVYHRRRDRPHKLCRCTLTEWRKWARGARKPAKAWNEA